MRRREFLAWSGTVLTVPCLPLPVAAQRSTRMRRVGVVMGSAADDPISSAAIVALVQGLQARGWTDGRNVRIEIRFSAENPELYRRNAEELTALGPDVILATNNSSTRAVLQTTRTISIVFVSTTDPVGGGLVESLARPGGNATGFTSVDFSAAAKWLELLKEIAPRVKRVAVIRDSRLPTQIGLFGAIQSAAPSFGVELRPLEIRDVDKLESAIAAFAREPDGGLIVTSGSAARVHHKLIIALAARHQLPAVYRWRHFVVSGGLVSYGPDPLESYRLAAGYIDRILKDEKPADLPVQQPTKLELVLNLKTAKALGLTVPEALLVRADEVIE
jgi:putative tryptophan/tyrosine transport system substrate-binding protein